jgi:hypothetical protein
MKHYLTKLYFCRQAEGRAGWIYLQGREVYLDETLPDKVVLL